jgi:hypothetical protein
MARRGPRREQVTVAELLVRSAHATTALPRARHREKPQALRSLTRLRVLSVVAGALALTGGVSAAVSMPGERSPGPAWPPVGLEPLPAALPPHVVTPPVPDSVAPPPKPAEIVPDAPAPKPDSAVSPRRRGKAVQAKLPVKPKVKAPAVVRHVVPQFPVWWWQGGPKIQDWQAAWAGRPLGHDGCGRHRR